MKLLELYTILKMNTIYNISPGNSHQSYLRNDDDFAIIVKNGTIMRYRFFTRISDATSWYPWCRIVEDKEIAELYKLLDEYVKNI